MLKLQQFKRIVLQLSLGLDKCVINQAYDLLKKSILNPLQIYSKNQKKILTYSAISIICESEKLTDMEGQIISDIGIRMQKIFQNMDQKIKITDVLKNIQIILKRTQIQSNRVLIKTRQLKLDFQIFNKYQALVRSLRLTLNKCQNSQFFFQQFFIKQIWLIFVYLLKQLQVEFQNIQLKIRIIYILLLLVFMNLHEKIVMQSVQLQMKEMDQEVQNKLQNLLKEKIRDTFLKKYMEFPQNDFYQYLNKIKIIINKIYQQYFGNVKDYSQSLKQMTSPQNILKIYAYLFQKMNKIPYQNNSLLLFLKQNHVIMTDQNFTPVNRAEKKLTKTPDNLKCSRTLNYEDNSQLMEQFQSIKKIQNQLDIKSIASFLDIFDQGNLSDNNQQKKIPKLDIQKQSPLTSHFQCINWIKNVIKIYQQQQKYLKSQVSQLYFDKISSQIIYTIQLIQQKFNFLKIRSNELKEKKHKFILSLIYLLNKINKSYINSIMNQKKIQSMVVICMNIYRFIYNEVNYCINQAIKYIDIQYIQIIKIFNQLYKLQLPLRIFTYLFNLERKIFLIYIWQQQYSFNIISKYNENNSQFLKRLESHVCFRIQQFINEFKFAENFKEQIKNCIGSLFEKHAELTKKINIDLLIMCTIYCIQKANNLNYVSFNQMFHQYLNLDHSFEEKKVMNDGSDAMLINFYNQTFIPHMKHVIQNNVFISINKKFLVDSVDNMIPQDFYKLSPYKTNKKVLSTPILKTKQDLGFSKIQIVDQLLNSIYKEQYTENDN